MLRSVGVLNLERSVSSWVTLNRPRSASVKLSAARLKVIGLQAHLLVGQAAEIHAGVTGGAVLGRKQRIAAPLLLVEPVFVASQISVESRIGREQRLLEFGDGVGDCIAGNLAAVNCFELLFVLGRGLELADDFLPRCAHLQGILHRAAGLFLQVMGSTIPELGKVEGGVEDGRRVDRALVTFDTLRDDPAVHASPAEDHDTTHR